MSPERNEPCPCGSGKKYKKCCGAIPLEQDPVKRNRGNAYSGEIGRLREQFCVDYTAYKKIMISRGEQLLRDELVGAGQTISCKKGCDKCCALYVFANLQEAECITYYLYQHEDVLKHFLSAYRDWHKGLGSMITKMERLNRMVAKGATERLTLPEMERFQADIHAYTMSRLPCPFLVNNDCSIYEVRPFACARLVATTPAEECQYDDPAANRAKYRHWGFKIEDDMPYFIKTRERVVSGCAPELVHSILEGGYPFLAGIEGLEKLKQFGAF
jgi:Fe-S-cluster containining protein